MTGKLVVIRGERPGHEHHLLNHRAILGRAEHADVVVVDRAVSRQHLEIVQDPGGFTARDLNSGNGVFLNGQRIVEAQLISGDRVKIGGHEFNFLQLSGPQRTAQTRRVIHHAPNVGAPAPVPYSAPPGPHSSPGQMVVGGGVRVNHPPTAPPIAPPMMHGGYMAPPPKKSSAPIVIGVILFVAITLALVAVIGIQLLNKKEEPTGPTPIEVASQKVDSGNEALAAHNLGGARDLFNQALERDPNSVEATDGLQRVATEQRMQSLLTEAEAAIGGRDYTAALIKLREVEQGSTLFAQDATARLGTLVDEIVRGGRQAVDGSDIDTAERLVQLALQNNPTHSSALALQTEIQQIRQRQASEATAPAEETDTAELVVAAAEPEESRSERRERRQSESTDRTESRRRSESSSRSEPSGSQSDGQGGSSNGSAAAETASTRTETRRSSGSSRSESSESDEPFSRGWRLYDAGQFDAAVTYFERQASRGGDDAQDAGRNAERIAEFKDKYEMGRRSYDEGDFDLATHDLSRARSLDRRLNSHYRDELTGMLAESHYQLAQAEYDRGRHKESGENARLALRYESTHSETRRLVRRLEDHANELYIEAVSYRESNPDRARQICRDIMAMLPESSSLRGRAEDLLETL